MSYGCHRRERAESFRRSNYVSHIPKEWLGSSQASLCIQKFESYFDGLAEESVQQGRSAGSKGFLRLKESSQEVQVEISGNTRNGSIVLRGGYSTYSEIHFSPRAIHVYRSEQEGRLGNEVAVYLNRRLPDQSFGFGVKTQLDRYLQSV
jgi:hypothetical protein